MKKQYSKTNVEQRNMMRRRLLSMIPYDQSTIKSFLINIFINMSFLKPFINFFGGFGLVSFYFMP